MSAKTLTIERVFKTGRLKFTHTGIDSFPDAISDFAFHNFEEGWNQIINISLTGFLEK